MNNHSSQVNEVTDTQLDWAESDLHNSRIVGEADCQSCCVVSSHPDLSPPLMEGRNISIKKVKIPTLGFMNFNTLRYVKSTNKQIYGHS